MTILTGRYELGEQLGSGGMGRVVAAHDHLLDRDVAVKLLSPDADETVRKRFVREARAAARLHHPNVVTVYDAGESEGQPYLVMELVRGRPLADVLDQDGPLEVEEAVAITVGVLDGLQAAHRAGMVHRDVKPGNVLLPDEGGVKLSDFGIAKALGDEAAEVTMAGVLVGTPTYLAPELLVGEPPSPASDIYGVGCLLYAQLTGGPPFTRGDAMAIAYAHRHEPVVPVESRRPDVPPELAAVVAAALAKEPAGRYPSAAAMRAALLGGVPADAPTVAVPVVVPGDRLPTRAHADDATRVVGTTAAGAGGAGAGPTGGAATAAGGRRVLPVVTGLAALLLLAAGVWVWLGSGSGSDVEEGETPLEEAPTEEPPSEEPPAGEPPVDEEQPEPGAPDDADPAPADEPSDQPPEEQPDETGEPGGPPDEDDGSGEPEDDDDGPLLDDGLPDDLFADPEQDSGSAARRPPSSAGPDRPVSGPVADAARPA